MPWNPNDAERHTHKATTWALQELWAKVANAAWNELATKAALSGKRTLWSRGRRKPTTSGADLAFVTSSSPHEPTGRPNARPMINSATCGGRMSRGHPGCRLAYPGNPD